MKHLIILLSFVAILSSCNTDEDISTPQVQTVESIDTTDAIDSGTDPNYNIGFNTYQSTIRISDKSYQISEMSVVDNTLSCKIAIGSYTNARLNIDLITGQYVIYQ